MPAGSKTDPPLAKAKPISASVITYLRRRKTLREGELLQPERGVRRCKKLCRHPEKKRIDATNRCPEQEKDRRSAGEHLKHSTKEFQPLQPVSSGAKLKCLSANACSMGNKQEELEICAHLLDYDLIGITEAWWDGSYDWSVGMERYSAFRKDRQGRGRGGVTLYVNDQLQCMELHLGMDEEPTKSLWVRTKGRAGTGDIIMEVCYRPPNQDNRADDALYRQIGAASHSQALVLREDFNHPDSCWRDNTAAHKQSRRFLECVDDNFLLQVTEEPRRRGIMLDLVLTNKEGLVGNAKLKGSLGCSDREMECSKAERVGGCSAWRREGSGEAL
ncbi:hypothetical protein GRJ2_000375800 [Grus japonensis]|uniref:Endonuclease/exonuclease/phosphatase domain-containing protein n=1 Tax=Grus japonensis TaxID=30415 RepID=A0ABC9W0V6_GRUJA